MLEDGTAQTNLGMACMAVNGLGWRLSELHARDEGSVMWPPILAPRGRRMQYLVDTIISCVVVGGTAHITHDHAHLGLFDDPYVLYHWTREIARLEREGQVPPSI